MMNEQDPNVAYSPSMWSKRFKTGQETVADFVLVSKKASAEVRKSVPHELNVPYGVTENQKTDFYGSKDLPKGSPVFAFIHGGYWIEGCRQDSAVMAKSLYDSGIITAVLGYDLVPAVSLDEMVQEIEDGIHHVVSWANDHGSKIWLCGFSAGAHLIAMTLTRREFKDIAGVVLVSGVYDLMPILETYVATDARIDRGSAHRNSPQARIDEICSKNGISFLVVVAEHDSPAFKQQSKTFHESLCRNGVSSEMITVKDVDHYSLITSLQFPHFEFTEKIVDMMKKHSQDETEVK